uniref:Uncharacterized protein n=1 Tax=Arundo donax TaxID=35708 RepID=A0A0A9FG93_ARUDO
MRLVLMIQLASSAQQFLKNKIIKQSVQFTNLQANKNRGYM